MTSSSPTLKSLYRATQDRFLHDFFQFLAFPSVSSEMEYRDEVRKCADWLRQYIHHMGFRTELWETDGHPVIFASYADAGPDQPTLLIYNHYDVQPVDPLELWDTPPFEPTVRGGQIYARGAQDNKGQCFYVLNALRLLIEKHGMLPINVKLCIEGEEETGSEGLSKILTAKQRELQADYLAIVDLGIQDPSIPAISLGVRGIVTMDVTAEGSKFDLHSGAQGGIVYNPIHALIDIFSKLRNPDGSVAIPGFYDAVAPLSESEKSQVNFSFNAPEYAALFQAEPSGGEHAYSPLERAWTRPTLELNGISGGYTGLGFKTVIPAKATAKISCRLVPHQDPDQIGRLVAARILDLAPKGIQLDVTIRPGVGRAVRSSPNADAVQAFSKAYEEVFGKKTEYIFSGGSIPIVDQLARASGASVVLAGLGLPDDQIHAPNEHFGLDRLEKGTLIIARALELLSS